MRMFVGVSTNLFFSARYCNDIVHNKLFLILTTLPGNVAAAVGVVHVRL